MFTEPQRSTRTINLLLFVAVALLFALVILSAGCGFTLPPCIPLCPTPGPTLFPPKPSGTTTPAATPPSATATPTPRPPTASPTATATASAGEIRFTRTRSWNRPAVPPGQRIRLTDDAGRLLIEWPKHLGGKNWQATLEDKTGAALQAVAVTVQHDARFHPAVPVGSTLLYRSLDKLQLGLGQLGAGTWEAYAGLPFVVAAWKTCDMRPCPASLFTAANSWAEQTWAVELFGVDLWDDAAQNAVIVGSREQPSSNGWTLRVVDGAALREGRVVVLRQQVWKPAAGVSLEDPSVVEGAAVPMLIGGAAVQVSGADWKPSGAVYVAEQDGELRQILQAVDSLGNADPGGAVWHGRLYVVAEKSATQSGIWGWSSTGLVAVETVDGVCPTVGAAEGRLWVATTAGLWMSDW